MSNNNNLVLPSTSGVCSRIKVVKAVLSMALILLSGTVVIAMIASNQIVQPAYAITFGSTKNLSNNDGDSLNPQVQVSSSNVYSVCSLEDVNEAISLLKEGKIEGRAVIVP